MSAKLMIVLGLMTLSSACSMPFKEVPQATNFTTTDQQKLQAAGHWNVIAKNTVDELATEIPLTTPLFISPSLQSNEFSRAFLSQLTTALVSKGFVVHKSQDRAFALDVSTQTLMFSGNRPKHKNANVLTALATGVWALQEFQPSIGVALFGGILASDVSTWLNSEYSSKATPKTEIIVTVSVSDQLRYIARKTKIYYVTDSDDRLYIDTPVLELPKPTLTKIIQVVG